MAQENNPQIVIRVTPYEYKLFKKFKDDYGLSARKVLELSGCPCDKCKNMNVITYSKDNGEEIQIPRGILQNK